MEYNLRKFSYTSKPKPSPKPKATNSSVSPTQEESHSSRTADAMAAPSDLKAEILSPLKKDIIALIRSELTDVMTKEFDGVKSELSSLKTEVAKNTANSVHSDPPVLAWWVVRGFGVYLRNW